MAMRTLKIVFVGFTTTITAIVGISILSRVVHEHQRPKLPKWNAEDYHRFRRNGLEWDDEEGGYRIGEDREE